MGEAGGHRAGPVVAHRLGRRAPWTTIWLSLPSYPAKGRARVGPRTRGPSAGGVVGKDTLASAVATLRVQSITLDDIQAGTERRE